MNYKKIVRCALLCMVIIGIAAASTVTAVTPKQRQAAAQKAKQKQVQAAAKQKQALANQKKVAAKKPMLVKKPVVANKPIQKKPAHKPAANNAKPGNKPQAKKPAAASRIPGTVRQLINTRVSCYFNATLQCLVHIPLFTNTLASLYLGNYLPNNSLTSDLYGVVNAYMNPAQNSQAMLDNFSASFAWRTAQRFFPRAGQEDAQEDASEFYVKLLNQASGTSDRGTGRVIIKGDIIGGQQTREALDNIFRLGIQKDLHCPTCNRISTAEKNVTTMLSLDIPQRKASLPECLHRFFAKNNDGDADFYCVGCRQRVAIEEQFFVNVNQLPPILTLHLKRFVFDQQIGVSRKKSDPITFPLTGLSLEAYLLPGQAAQRASYRPYDLVGIICHSGDVGGGHYIAYIKNVGNNNRWYRCDDSRIQGLTDGQMADFATAGIDQNGPSFTPYMLFYQQRPGQLLSALNHPDAQFHNNATRLKVWRDILIDLYKTCKKFAISFWDFLGDRIHKIRKNPAFRLALPNAD